MTIPLAGKREPALWSHPGLRGEVELVKSHQKVDEQAPPHSPTWVPSATIRVSVTLGTAASGW